MTKGLGRTSTERKRKKMKEIEQQRLLKLEQRAIQADLEKLEEKN